MAGEWWYPDVESGRENYDRQVDESTLSMIPLHPRLPAVRAGVDHRYRGDVDDGDCPGVGGVGDSESDFSGAADGFGDEVASRVQSRVLVRLR